MRLAAERASGRAAARPRRRRVRVVLSLLVVALGAALHAARAVARRLQRHARATRLRQADRDRLLGRARAVLALPDVFHLLANELAGRGRRAPSAAQLLPRSLHRASLWHD